MVSGVNSSALFSITKLRNLSDRHGTAIVYSALLPEIRSRLEARGLLGEKTRHRAFAEAQLCADLVRGSDACRGGYNRRKRRSSGFHQWLQHQFGPVTNAAEFVTYLEQKEISASEVLYRRGEAADTIDFVAAGTLSIDVESDGGKIVRLRRMTTHTVIGEMGFFRRSTRSATVSSEGPATLFTLNRDNFERLRRERPELAAAFNEFVIRVLAERIDFSNGVVAAMSHN